MDLANAFNLFFSRFERSEFAQDVSRLRVPATPEGFTDFPRAG